MKLQEIAWYEVHEVFEGRVCDEIFLRGKCSGLCKASHSVFSLIEAKEYAKKLKDKNPEKEFVAFKVVETKEPVE